MNDLNQKPNTPGFDRWQMARLAFDMGYIIALPLVAMALLGKYLDEKYGSDPYLTLAGILIAIVLTTLWLTKKFKGYINSSK